MPNSIDFSQVKAVAIPEGDVIKIEVSGTVIWKKGPTNRVPLSINPDGSIYNGGLGYKNGYRVRSGGLEASYSNATCTGFIKVNPGDVIRLSGWNFMFNQAGNAINVANASFENIGQFTAQNARYGIFESAYKSYAFSSVTEEKSGVYKWVVPPVSSGVTYIRITAFDSTNGSPGARMIVTINEEI